MMTTRKPHKLLNRRFTHEGGVWSGEQSGNEHSDSEDEQRIHQGRASIRRVGHNLYFAKKISRYGGFSEEFISPKIRRYLTPFCRNIDCFTGFRTQDWRNYVCRPTPLLCQVIHILTDDTISSIVPYQPWSASDGFIIITVLIQTFLYGTAAATTRRRRRRIHPIAST